MCIFELFGSIRLTNILDHVTVSNYLYVGFSYISVLFFLGNGNLFNFIILKKSYKPRRLRAPDLFFFLLADVRRSLFLYCFNINSELSVFLK